jgi:hypothetical protein
VLFGLGAARNRTEQAVAELEEARDELLRHGDPEKAAEAEAIAAFETAGSTTRSLARLEQALGLVRDRPPSRSKALVLARLAYRAASIEDRAWREHANEALAMTESLGLEELRAAVLIAIGTATALQPGAIEALEQAVEVTDAIDSPESIRARINLAAELQAQGDIQRGFELHAQARSDAQRFGVLEAIQHLRSELVWEEYWRGNWEECCREADALRAELEADEGPSAPVSRIFTPFVQALIRLARDDLAGALGDSEQAVRLARRWPTWGNLGSVVAGSARVQLSAGRTREAEAQLSETLDIGLNIYGLPHLAVTLVLLDRGDDFRVVADRSPGPSAWLDAATAFVGGDYVGAADIYAEIGSLPDEADARLRSGIESEVLRALEFYRSVGATRYIREAESLLAASA